MNYGRIIIGGRIARDLELKQTSTGKSCLNLCVAVNRNGETNEADFFEAVAFGNQAETIHKFFNKGNNILLDGRPTIKKWQTQDGSKRESFQMIVDRFDFIDKKEATTTAPASVYVPEAYQTPAQFTEIAGDQDLPF